MNIRRLIGLLGILMILSACNEQKKELVEVPKVLIPTEKMAKILSEVELIEAYLNQIPYSKRGNNDSDYVYYPRVFEKYNISKADFLENLDYYSNDEETISAIYDESIIILNKLKAKDLEIRLEMKMDSIRLDSIKDAKALLKKDSIQKVEQALLDKK